MGTAKSTNTYNTRRIPSALFTSILRSRFLLFCISTSVLCLAVSSQPLPLPHTTYHENRSAATTRLYAKRRTFNVRVAAATCAAVSMTASVIVFYWFYRMEKRFRHRLIMLLIYGDLVKASWLFIFAVTSITQGTIRTHSPFCQASGFFLQYGTETSDYAVLVIAVHSAIQVFRPSQTVRSDGLYPYRYFVYAGAIFFPALMAGLAFINPNWGYMSQGAFCTLPIRPFWYRLALAWIPRYLIATIILGIAVAIYAHVGFEFRAFSTINEQSGSFLPSVSTPSPRLSAGEMEEARTERTGTTSPEPVAPDAVPTRRFSTVTFQSTLSSVDEEPPRHHSLPASSVYLPHTLHHHRTSDLRLHLSSTTTKTRTSTTNMPPSPSHPSHPQAPHSPSLTPSPPSHPISPVQHLAQTRSRIHRQLRLLFIYPLVYIAMWLIPFASHCMMYQDKWAKHPLWWLSLSSTICVTLMGGVDCLIFTWRERPWRDIQGGDGSFWGSFGIRRGAGEKKVTGGTVDKDARPSMSAATATGTAPLVPAPTNTDSSSPPIPVPTGRSVCESAWLRSSIARTSGSSDWHKVARDLAKTRLEQERADRSMGVGVARRDWEESGDSMQGSERYESEGYESGDEGDGSEEMMGLEELLERRSGGEEARRGEEDGSETWSRGG